MKIAQKEFEIEKFLIFKLVIVTISITFDDVINIIFSEVMDYMKPCPNSVSY